MPENISNTEYEKLISKSIDIKDKYTNVDLYAIVVVLLINCHLIYTGKFSYII